MTEEKTDGLSEHEKHRLWTSGQKNRKGLNPLYTKFVRVLRITLPVIAVGIVAMLLLWPQAEDVIEKIPVDITAPQQVGKNELINPRFESVDEQSQPFIVTATKAIQNAKNSNVIMLQNPKADIKLTSGEELGAEALEGTYLKSEEKLLLEKSVKLNHSTGYTLESEKMLVNLKEQQVSSDNPVSGAGPAGTIEATGMQGDNTNELLIFTGPAKLILKESLEGI